MIFDSDFSRLCEKNVFPNGIPLQKLLCNVGNHKIPSSTAIFNMGSATDCPSLSLGLCKVQTDNNRCCYALKAEVLYPNVLPYRRRQELYWNETSAEQFAFQFLLINSKKRNPFNALRLNESGDFHSQQCVEKAESIARILSRYGVTTYCYTSRSDLDFKRVKSLIVNGSGFKGRGISNVFKMITEKKKKPKGYAMCAMNCRICARCMQRGMNTCVIKH